MENGCSAGVAAVGPDGMVGHDALLGMRRSSVQASVQVPGDALSIATRHFLPLMERYLGLRLAVLLVIASIQAEAMQLAACHALHSARSRLARFLLMTQDRMGQPAMHMHMTQELLAEVLGVQRTTVTAAALSLMSEGLIVYRRGRIDIIDRTGLKAAACECYGAIRQISERREGLPCGPQRLPVRQ
jgi:CRP-like cAMP-binding protein